MNYTQIQKVAILKSLLFIVDADEVFSIQEKQFLRWFSIQHDEPLDPLLQLAKQMSISEMKEIIASFTKDMFREIQNLWYMCSRSDEVVPIELQVIVDLMQPKVEIEHKPKLTKEDIPYIINTYDNVDCTNKPSDDFLTRYNDLNTQCETHALKETFLKNQQITNTLGLLEINEEFFWYLVVFVKDVVEEKCASAYKIIQGVVDAICGLSDIIDGITKKESCRALSHKDEFPNDAYIEFNRKIKLTIASGKDILYKCNNDHAIFLIAHACEHLLRDHKHIIPDFCNDSKEFPKTRKFAMFYRIMLQFLKDKKPKTTMTNISSDLYLLVARLLHTIGWLENDAYIEDHDTNRYTTNKKFKEYIKNVKSCPCKGYGFNTVYYEGIEV